MKHVGLLVLGSFINSLGTGLSASGLAAVMLRVHGTASSVAAVQMSAFAPIVLLAPLARVLPDRPRLLPIVVKPASGSAVMGGAAWAVYGLLSRILSSEQVDQAGQTVRAVSRMGNAAGIFLAIAVAGVVYLVLVIALRAISRDDLALMPKGDKIAKLLRIR